MDLYLVNKAKRDLPLPGLIEQMLSNNFLDFFGVLRRREDRGALVYFQHLARSSGQRQIPLRLIPGIDPVHHAEERKGRHAEIDFSAAFLFPELFDKAHENFHVAPFKYQDFCLGTPR